MNKLLALVLPLVLVLSFLISGCGGSNAGTKSSAITPATAPRGITGTISTGKTVAAASVKIPSGGGTLAVSEQGTPITGLELTIPANAYTGTNTFEISYAPIEKHTFGKNFNPVVPLITVENGGTYSEDLMTVRIPVKVPEGSFAMGFYYDAKTSLLEGMPLIASDSNSITVATRHFSSFTVSVVTDALLNGNVDTGYKPGVDDWQLDNDGSIIVGAQCAGQSISSIWYYSQRPDGAEAHLYNRYDNDGDPNFKTPDFKEDDSLARKLVTSLQVDYEDKNLPMERNFRNITRVNDSVTYKLFAYSMMTTGAPQLLVTSSGVGGHALAAYKIVDGLLYVADPNSPGKTTVNYKYNNVNGKFDSDSTIYYMATSALVSWQQVASRWQELKSGTIGNDRYPGYDFMVFGDKGDWEVLKDNYIAQNNKILLRVSPNGRTRNAELRAPIIYGMGDTRTVDGFTREIELKPGKNRFGVRITGKIPTVVDGSSWADFKYYNVFLGAPTALAIDPPTMDGQEKQLYTFNLVNPEKINYVRLDWLIDGDIVMPAAAPKLEMGFGPGDYTVTVNLYDLSHKLLGTAESSVHINAVKVSNLPKLQQLKSIAAGFTGYNTYTVWTPSGTTTGPISNGFGGTVPITWSGTSFSGKTAVVGNNGDTSDEISGTVSDDGNTLLTLTFAHTHSDYYGYGKGNPNYSLDSCSLQFQNIPLNTPSGGFGIGKLSGAVTQQSVVKMEDRETRFKDNAKNYEDNYVSTDWSATGSRFSPEIRISFGK